MSGRYIVVFKDTASQQVIDSQATEVTENGGSVKNRFDSILKGFTAEIPDNYLLRLQSNLQEGSTQIDYIEPDQVVTTQGN